MGPLLHIQSETGGGGHLLPLRTHHPGPHVFHPDRHGGGQRPDKRPQAAPAPDDARDGAHRAVRLSSRFHRVPRPAVFERGRRHGPSQNRCPHGGGDQRRRVQGKVPAMGYRRDPHDVLRRTADDERLSSADVRGQRSVLYPQRVFCHPERLCHPVGAAPSQNPGQGDDHRVLQQFLRYAPVRHRGPGQWYGRRPGGGCHGRRRMGDRLDGGLWPELCLCILLRGTRAAAGVAGQGVPAAHAGLYDGD